ncbi:MAG TPA: EAL domain-containing protein [Mycobacteriales bacterium]|nr:EAL domain-containing protein [Mycobacteriales bacterium]
MTADRRPALVGAVCWTTAAAGVSAFLVTGVLSGWQVAQPWLALGFLAAMLAGEHFPLHLTHDGDSEALRLEEAFLLPMLVLLTPVEALSAVALSTAAVHATHRRGLQKAAFNVGMATAVTAAALGASRALGLSTPLGPDDVAAVLAAGLLYCVVTALAVSGVISLATGDGVRSLLTEGAAIRIATWLGSLCLGLLVLVAAEQRTWVLVAAVVPVTVLQLAYAGALRQWRERRQAEALYEAAARVRRSDSSAEIGRALEAAARELLEAGSARVVAVGEDAPEGALRAELGDGTAVEVADRATGGRWSAADESRLQALAAVAASARAQALLHEQVQSITRSLGEGVLALDADGVVTFANPAAEQLLGWASGGLVGRHVTVVDPPVGLPRGERGSGTWAQWSHVRAGRTVRLDEHVLVRADGRPVDVALTASPVVEGGEVAGAVVVLRDVRERLALERRLVHQAFHDPLTGLPNRTLFLDRLEHARRRSRGADDLQAVLFVDLDRFKLVNDSLGHRVGDEVLCTVASRMVGVLREGDTVARFGGDEFTVLLEGLSRPEEAVEAAERVVRALRLPLRAGDREVALSASIGIAVAEPGDESSDLLAAADIAMYEAKSGGKDRWSVAAAGADDRALARLDLELELRRAIDAQELELHYQPVVRADDGALYGMEALVRWRHPTLGLLGPSAFMELAEDTGLVVPLGEWVLDRACQDATAWLARHPGSPARFAVNLSARQFAQPDLRDRVAGVLHRTGMDPQHLVLEITETVVMQDSERVLETLAALRGLHVELAVDDFGTGYSSLSYLKRFPVDTIKIDKAFVDGLGSSAVDREIVQAVVRLAGAVGMHTVAEGVETTRQLEQLRLLGCDAVQGFLLAAPQPLADVERVLADLVPAVPRPRRPERDLRVLKDDRPA